MSERTPSGEDSPLRRIQCPDCPDGQVWNRKGPTADACLTCGGEAFIWTSEPPDPGVTADELDDNYRGRFRGGL